MDFEGQSGLLHDVEFNKKQKPKGVDLCWKKRGRIMLFVAA